MDEALLFFSSLMWAHKASAIQAGDGKMCVIFEAALESGTEPPRDGFLAKRNQQKPTHIRQ